MNGLPLACPQLDISVKSWQFLSRPERYRREWRKVHPKAHKLLPEATGRQLRTAMEIVDRFRNQFGLLLADDVGLGKTLVAVLVAGVFAGTGKRVRILAPNETMRRKWEQEAREHFAVLAGVADLDISPRCVKGPTVSRLHDGRVQVATHAKASSRTYLKCDLLIVDEAHRARGEDTLFRKELESQRRKGAFNRVLFLTATPFSIDHQQLVNMLKLIGASPDERRRVKTFGNLLDAFWGTDRFSAAKWEQQIREKREDAISALKPWVIRHSVEELGETEQAYFGMKDETWTPKIPDADDSILEVLLRTDRMLRLGKQGQLIRQERTNDPRFHVGWNQLRREVDNLKATAASERSALSGHPVAVSLVDMHAERITVRLQELGEHPKISAVADEIARVVEQEQEKVLVFCHHHATAVEIAISLNERLSANTERRPIKMSWRRAWECVLASANDDYDAQRLAFARWLCCPALLRQILCWVRPVPAMDDPQRMTKWLVAAFERERPRGDPSLTVGEAARRLFDSLGPSGSKSTQDVLRRAAKQPFIRHLPDQRVVALADPGETDLTEQTAESRLFYRKQPDTIMAIFNSPFGPEVLVTTDRLSEGVDLHRYSRHIVHYELSPSPIRVLQRNGRVRRLGSWASRTRRPIRIAYPRFRGTRDERLVDIVKGRLERFYILLGGTGARVEESTMDHDERWKYEILEKLPDLRGSLSVV